MCSMKYPDWENFMANSFAGRRKFPLIADELPTFLGVPHVTSKDELKGQDVVIIGAPYVATATDKYAGVDKWEWISGPKRVRQQSVRYGSGYIQDFDIDVFEHLNVVDYGDADIPEEVNVFSDAGEHSEGAGGGGGEGRRRAGGRGHPDCDRPELASGVFCDSQVDFGAHGGAGRVRQPGHPLGRGKDRPDDQRPPHRRKRQLEAQDVRVPWKTCTRAPL